MDPVAILMSPGSVCKCVCVCVCVCVSVCLSVCLSNDVLRPVVHTCNAADQNGFVSCFIVIHASKENASIFYANIEYQLSGQLEVMKVLFLTTFTW